MHQDSSLLFEHVYGKFPPPGSGGEGCPSVLAGWAEVMAQVGYPWEMTLVQTLECRMFIKERMGSTPGEGRGKKQVWAEEEVER